VPEAMNSRERALSLSLLDSEPTWK